MLALSLRSSRMRCLSARASGRARSRLASAPVGSTTLQLLGVYSSLDEHKGHRMEAKGFIVKDPAGDRLNVVSLEMVAASCGG